METIPPLFQVQSRIPGRVDSSLEGIPHECLICHSQGPDKVLVLPVFDGPYQGDVGGHARSFYRCSNCGYLFVYPFEPVRYARYYAALKDNYHEQHDSETSRYSSISGALQALHVNSILDWGCGKGTFLSYFSDDIKKYGVEMSSAAARCAQRANIRILTPEEIGQGQIDQSIDAVTAIDVAEHIADLNQFRDVVARTLRPGGTFAILTGNLDSPAAKFLGRYWYYVHYGEHVSFLTERAVSYWLQDHFEDIRIIPTVHHKTPYLDLLRAWASFPIAWLLERVGMETRLRKSAKIYVNSDHMLILARRRAG